MPGGCGRSCKAGRLGRGSERSWADRVVTGESRLGGHEVDLEEGSSGWGPSRRMEAEQWAS